MVPYQVLSTGEPHKQSMVYNIEFLPPLDKTSKRLVSELSGPVCQFGKGSFVRKEMLYYSEIL